MMMFRKKMLAISLFVLIATNYLNAQSTTRFIEFGAGISTYVYQGDLTPNAIGAYETMRGGAQLHGSLVLSPSILVRANLAFGGLRASDSIYTKQPFREQRDFNFSTPVLELTGLLVWNPLRSNDNDKGFSPYLMGGVGISFLDIQRDRTNFNPDYFSNGTQLLQLVLADEAQTLPKSAVVFPVGIGARYAISPSLAVYAESTYRFMLTDYLDGFSLAANPEGNDSYQTISAGIIFRPWGNSNNGRMGCPVPNY